MTMTQLVKEAARVAVIVVLPAVAADDPFPTVDKTTPATIDAKDNNSGGLKYSIFHRTHKAALVMGSAALMVSTNAGEEPEKPILVAKNPMVKNVPAKNKYRDPLRAVRKKENRTKSGLLHIINHPLTLCLELIVSLQIITACHTP